MSDVEEINMAMSDDEDESAELQEPNTDDNAAQNQLSIEDQQQSVMIHTDTDLSDTGSMVSQENDNYNADAYVPPSHKRSGSMAEKRENIQQQKKAMEERLRTLSQTLNIELDGALDEFAEMEEINEDKRLFGELFDKIDPDDNGDVDEKEWIQGLRNLNVHIEETDMAKLFKLMDGDKSGYIDRQDWITFCMTSYNSKELQRLHDSVLNNIKGHSRKPSNMFHATDVNDWSASAVKSLEKQMTQAFLKQGVDEMAKAEEEEEYFVSMEKEAENNPEWCKQSRALEWTPKEVAFWLDTIELSQYARKFDEEQLDGSILLNDCDKNLLQLEMSIKPLHVGKILREVDKLRQINKEQLQDSYMDWNELIEENKRLMQELETQQNQMKELQNENAELRLQSTMSAVNNGGNIANPMAPEMTPPTETTKGVYEDDVGGLEYKTQTDPHYEVKLLTEEIEHLHKQKIIFAENSAREMGKLNAIIGVLSKDYRIASTPLYKKFNPMDSLIRSLGYQPNSGGRDRY